MCGSRDGINIRKGNSKDIPAWIALSREYDNYVLELVPDLTEWYDGGETSLSFQKYMEAKIEQGEVFIAERGSDSSSCGIIAISTKNNRITFFGVTHSCDFTLVGEQLMQHALNLLDTNRNITINEIKSKAEQMQKQFKLLGSFGFVKSADGLENGVPVDVMVRSISNNTINMNQDRFTDCVIRGHTHYWEMLGGMRGIRHHQDPHGRISWLSGDVDCAYRLTFAGPDYEKEVAAVAAKVKARELPGRLVVLPDAAPLGVDVGALFRAQGFTVEADCGMAKELTAAASPAPPKELYLFRVRETQQLKTAGAMLNGAFEYDLFSFGHYLDAFNHPAVRFYLAEHDGIPAGACMSLLGDDFVEIAWVGTLTGYRKKGIAGWLMGLAEQDARSKGRTVAVLSAFPGAINAYRRAGYAPCCEIQIIQDV